MELATDSKMAQVGPAESRRTIVVDLDGTLIHSDLLVECVFLFLKRHPLRFWQLFLWLWQGKAVLKRQLVDLVAPAAQTLPYNLALMNWLDEQRAAGARLVLATASDLRLARAIAAHTSLFDEVLGTQERNLAARHKQEALVELYGELGYEYVGNSRDDLAVWKSASVVHVANPDLGVLARAHALGRPGQVFSDQRRYASALRRALRLHQWAKNLLLFVPLVAAHKFTDLSQWRSAVLAFLCFGACASSVYLLNDLLDLQEDREHRSKRFRPLAAGAFPIFHAMAWMPALLVLAFGMAALWLPRGFVLVLGCYYGLTMAYSLWLKRVVMLDVVTLAMLYTVRVVAGAAAVSVPLTFWLLAFSVFIFLSLAFVKRYTELGDAREKGRHDAAPGRGYQADDFELLSSFGASAGYLSVLVLALYINDGASLALYHRPQWMWLACPLLLYWLSRVWLLAHRGKMHDDPIVFALRDRVSQFVGLLFMLVFVLAAV